MASRLPIGFSLLHTGLGLPLAPWAAFRTGPTQDHMQFSLSPCTGQHMLCLLGLESCAWSVVGTPCWVHGCWTLSTGGTVWGQIRGVCSYLLCSSCLHLLFALGSLLHTSFKSLCPVMTHTQTFHRIRWAKAQHLITSAPTTPIPWCCHQSMQGNHWGVSTQLHHKSMSI